MNHAQPAVLAGTHRVPVVSFKPIVLAAPDHGDDLHLLDHVVGHARGLVDLGGKALELFGRHSGAQEMKLMAQITVGGYYNVQVGSPANSRTLRRRLHDRTGTHQ